MPADSPLLVDLLRQCAQPTWSEHRLSGKVEIDKGAPSPDLFDALCLAFAADSAGGLSAARPKSEVRRLTWGR